MFSNAWINRQLIVSLAARDIQSRYRGSFAGLGWAIINPIILLGSYTFIFSVIFHAKWNEGLYSKSEFSLVIFSGMIIYNIFAECIGRSPTLIVSNANYVKKVIFPLDILPIVFLISSLFHGLIGFIVWIVFYFVFIGFPHYTIVFSFFTIIPLLFYILGLSWLISSLGVFFRDIIQVVNLLLTVLMFLSPVFYPLSAIPDKIRFLAYFNPLVEILEQTRNVLFDLAPVDWQWLLLSILTSILCALFGFVWFQKTRKGFADVI